ncbi:hypothetical protein V6N13_036328 [Hibiscus sabdariffa]
MISYLFEYCIQNIALQVHEMNFTATFAVVVFDSVYDLASRIENSAAIGVAHERFHPNSEGLASGCRTLAAGNIGDGCLGMNLFSHGHVEE